MKVIKIYDLYRNDCTMDCQCEHCGHIDIDTGAYNDSNYVYNVVPSRFCSACDINSKGEKKIKLKFVGIDDFNRPVFKNIKSNSHYGSTNKLFDYSTNKTEIIDYFRSNINDLVYFGNKFNCEPDGSINKTLILTLIE